MKVTHMIAKSLTLKIILFFIILFAIPSFLLINHLYNTSKEISFNEYGEYLISNLKSTGDNFDEILRNVEFVHTQVISDNEFLESISKLTTLSQTPSYDQYQVQNSIMSKLNKYYISNNYIHSLVLYNNTGNSLYMYSINYNQNNVINNISDDLSAKIHTYVDSKDKRIWYITEELLSNDLIFSSISIPNLFNVKEGPVYFMVNVDTNLLKNRLTNTFSNSSIGLYVIDSQNNLLSIKDSSQGISTPILYTEFSENVPIKQQSGYQSIMVNNESYIMAYYKTDFTNYTYVAYAPLQSVVKLPLIIKKYRNLFILTLCILFLIVLFVTFKYVLHPVKSLHKSFLKVGEGDLSVRLVVHSNDEIGQIYYYFNEMLEKLNILITENFENKLIKKETELKYIHSQINEHFLYNTLDSIHWIAKKNNVPEISKIIFSLSKFFRMVLSEGNDTIPIAHIIEIFTHYVALLNIRMEQKIMYSYHVDVGLENIKVLKYIFQPLLENAILHGIGNDETGGKINVSFTRTTNHTIRFSVSDNGIGIDPIYLQIIQKNICHESDQPQDGQYFALTNINQQLRLFYGTAYSLCIESELGNGTTVYFDIPFCDNDIM